MKKKQKSIVDFAIAQTESEELFKLIDADHSGTIELKELAVLMREMGVECSQRELLELFKALDSNKDGHISLSEFKSGMKWLGRGFQLPQGDGGRSISDLARELRGGDDAVARARELFALIDENRDGSISPAELARMLREFGVDCGADEAAQLFRALDSSGDGRIDFREFLDGMAWVQRSMELRPVVRDEERSRVLRETLRATVARGLDVAEREKSLSTAKLIFEVLDIPLLIDMESVVVEGEEGIVSEADRARFERISKKIEKASAK